MLHDILVTYPFAITSNGNTYYYTNDANKNITELIASNGNITGHYEYSPFGTITSATGTLATSNPFRFSSEYFDTDLGLVYYNYRHYNPRDGKWINRDPIGERGGNNLYGIVNNNPLNAEDHYGLFCPVGASGTPGGGTLPPAVPQPKSPREQCNDTLNIYKQKLCDDESYMKKMWNKYTEGKKCDYPAFKCSCCPFQAWGLGDEFRIPLLGGSGTVTLCYQKGRMPDEETFIHELIHGAQYCAGRFTNNSTCLDIVKNEVDAHMDQRYSWPRAERCEYLREMAESLVVKGTYDSVKEQSACGNLPEQVIKGAAREYLREKAKAEGCSL